MKHKLLLIILTIVFVSCNDKSEVCSANCQAENTSTKISCKLTNPELEKRKETVIASLKNQVKETKEISNGYAFKFAGTDKTIDELIEFTKTERECCDFFPFNISISGNKNEIWFSLTGPKEAKQFISGELGL